MQARAALGVMASSNANLGDTVRLVLVNNIGDECHIWYLYIHQWIAIIFPVSDQV